jgi:dTDP-4-dehydrorhamnose 3,5-epimerase
VALELSAENKRQLWIPEGFAHGFLVLGESAEFLYKTTDYYHAGSEQTLLWNDPDLQIEWPLQLCINPLVSDKDARAKSLSSLIDDRLLPESFGQ